MPGLGYHGLAMLPLKGKDRLTIHPLKIGNYKDPGCGTPITASLGETQTCEDASKVRPHF